MEDKGNDMDGNLRIYLEYSSYKELKNAIFGTLQTFNLVFEWRETITSPTNLYLSKMASKFQIESVRVKDESSVFLELDQSKLEIHEAIISDDGLTCKMPFSFLIGSKTSATDMKNSQACENMAAVLTARLRESYEQEQMIHPSVSRNLHLIAASLGCSIKSCQTLMKNEKIKPSYREVSCNFDILQPLDYKTKTHRVNENCWILSLRLGCSDPSLKQISINDFKLYQTYSHEKNLVLSNEIEISLLEKADKITLNSYEAYSILYEIKIPVASLIQRNLLNCTFYSSGKIDDFLSFEQAFSLNIDLFETFQAESNESKLIIKPIFKSHIAGLLNLFRFDILFLNNCSLDCRVTIRIDYPVDEFEESKFRLIPAKPAYAVILTSQDSFRLVQIDLIPISVGFADINDIYIDFGGVLPARVLKINEKIQII